MSLTPEQIADLQVKAAENETLKQRLAALDSKKAEILDEKKQRDAQVAQLQAEIEALKTSGEQKTFEERDQLLSNLQRLQEEQATLRRELEEERQSRIAIEQQRVADRLKADFTTAFAGAVHSPSHVWRLVQDSIEDRGGVTVAVVNGKELPVTELVQAMAEDSSYSYLFKPAKRPGSGGMSLRASAGDAAPSSNPYLSGSVTQRIALENENPDLAARLKREASNARSAG